MDKISLNEFRVLYSRKPWTDEDIAEIIVERLPEDLPLVQASRAFLEACRVFDAALEAAGVQRE